MVKTRSMHLTESQSLSSNSGYSRSEDSQSRITRGKVAKNISQSQIYRQLAKIPFSERRIAKALLTDNSDRAWDEYVVYHLANVCGRCTHYPNLSNSKPTVNKRKLRPRDSREIYRRRQKPSSPCSDEIGEDDSEPTEEEKPRQSKPKQRKSLHILSNSDVIISCIDKGEITGSIIQSGAAEQAAVENSVAEGQNCEDNNTQMKANLEASDVNNNSVSQGHNADENSGELSALNCGKQVNNGGQKSWLFGIGSISKIRNPFIIDSDGTGTSNDISSPNNQNNEGNPSEQSAPYEYFM